LFTAATAGGVEMAVRAAGATSAAETIRASLVILASDVLTALAADET
jgi:hypothetical protein